MEIKKGKGDFDFTSILQLMQEAEDLVLVSNQNGSPYQVITSCLALYSRFENQIIQLYNMIRYFYAFQFPELESLLNHHPIDYMRVVRKIGKEVDVSNVDLQGLLPPALIMVVSIVASTTSGSSLTEKQLDFTIHACNQALALDSVKTRLLELMGTRAECVAPNLCAVLGNFVASKLMAAAGGVRELANMAACDIMVLGAKMNNVAGFSTASLLHVGYIEETQVFKTTPPTLRKKVCRQLAGKSVLAARVDSVNGDPSGNVGRTLREAVHEKIEKWQELPPAKQPKPLSMANLGLGKRKKRGGRRLRKLKERYAATDLRKCANRVQFGVPENSSPGNYF